MSAAIFLLSKARFHKKSNIYEKGAPTLKVHLYT